MCALFGWLDYKSIVSYKILEKLTQELANAAEEGGADAAGISYVKDGRITVFKKPKPAHMIHFSAPDDTKAVMGHTRLATQGDKTKNYNNHPFEGHADKEFAFAHNGVLWNDKELRKDGIIPNSCVDTDSYIGVQLIEKQGKLDFESLQYMAETVEGIFTFSVLDQFNNLYIVKGSNPMYLFQFEEIGLYVYASTESIMNNALKQLELYNSKYKSIDVEEGNILRIDKNGIIKRTHFKPKIHQYHKYAEQGDADAKYKLGFMNQNGYGVTQDYKEAVKWYHKAAEQGHTKAQYSLGVMYEKGYGVEQNKNISVEWYRKAAKQGDADAQCNLGFMYENGYGVTQDYEETIKWYRKAAEQGHTNGQYNLGVMYYMGYGVTQDYEEAAKWYRKAAEKGYTDAQCNLAYMYEMGYGVMQDYEEAAKWYRKAAEKGDADAQCNLAYMYEMGYGVSKDSSKAIEWYSISAAQGNEIAKKILKN